MQGPHKIFETSAGSFICEYGCGANYPFPPGGCPNNIPVAAQGKSLPLLLNKLAFDDML